MNYALKLTLYILSKAFLYAGIVGFIHSLIMLFAVPEENQYWLIRSVLFFLISCLALFLYIFRKSKIPLPGRDYR